MDTLVRTLRERGGVATWSELKAVTVREHLEQALEDRTVTRVRRNLYVSRTCGRYDASPSRPAGWPCT